MRFFFCFVLIQPPFDVFLRARADYLSFRPQRACDRKTIGSHLSDVHTMPEKFENECTALFLRLGLPSTLIRHENRAFRKRSLNRRNLKMLAGFVSGWTKTTSFSLAVRFFFEGKVTSNKTSETISDSAEFNV